jgi:hypothetical protein
VRSLEKAFDGVERFEHLSTVQQQMDGLAQARRIGGVRRARGQAQPHIAGARRAAGRVPLRLR